jgi:hypothetical protein
MQKTIQHTDDDVTSVALLTCRAKDGSVTHGSHTASTAAGNHGIVSDNPLYRGTMSGMAPAARLAIYKVRWQHQTFGNAVQHLVLHYVACRCCAGEASANLQQHVLLQMKLRADLVSRQHCGCSNA